MNNAVFEEPTATKLESERDKARDRLGRIMYDCFNLKIMACGDRVRCDVNRIGWGKDGSMPLVTTLHGRTSSKCHECKDFDGEPIGG